jgi:hypothetical protein
MKTIKWPFSSQFGGVAFSDGRYLAHPYMFNYAVQDAKRLPQYDKGYVKHEFTDGTIWYTFDEYFHCEDGPAIVPAFGQPSVIYGHYWHGQLVATEDYEDFRRAQLIIRKGSEETGFDLGP